MGLILPVAVEEVEKRRERMNEIAMISFGIEFNKNVVCTYFILEDTLLFFSVKFICRFRQPAFHKCFKQINVLTIISNISTRTVMVII